MPDFRTALRQLPWKPVPWALALALLGTGATCSPVDREEDPRGAIVAALARDGLIAALDDVQFLGQPTTFGTTQGIVRAWKRGEPADIYHFRAKMTSGGAVVGEPTLFNLTATPADEGPFKVSGRRVAFAVRAPAGTIGVRVLDLRGEGPLDGTWSRKARLQNAVTNLQQTGQTEGVRSEFWAIDPPMDEIDVALTPDA
jgi:hypothetical protein